MISDLIGCFAQSVIWTRRRRVWRGERRRRSQEIRRCCPVWVETDTAICNAQVSFTSPIMIKHLNIHIEFMHLVLAFVQNELHCIKCINSMYSLRIKHRGFYRVLWNQIYFIPQILYYLVPNLLFSVLIFLHFILMLKIIQSILCIH